MNTKVFIESYEAPRVEVIEVAVEKGFAGSTGSLEQLGNEEIW